MKFLFVVQGEGRGHMTQAITLQDLLIKNGHEVVHVIVGKSKRRVIPEFFLERINSPVSALESPNFVTDRRQKSVKPLATIFNLLLKSPQFSQSIEHFDEIMNDCKPDVVINFYEFLAGLYHFSKKPKCHWVSIGHQFLANLPSFPFPKGQQIEKMGFKLANKLAAYGSDRILALSFDEQASTSNANLMVSPPLLRPIVLEQHPERGKHILIYIVNPGYAEEIIKYHRLSPNQKLIVYWDKKDEPTTKQISKFLTFKRLNEEEFVHDLATCCGYISTAGFESICEAHYLSKPVMMIPVAGHFEQLCNAQDASRVGIGLHSNDFDIGKFIDYLPQHANHSERFKDWVRSAESFYLKHLTQWP